MDENRLIDIESKLAHQEYLLSELNTALSDQQTQLTQLAALCESLLERLQGVGDSLPEGEPANDPPPHY